MNRLTTEGGYFKISDDLAIKGSKVGGYIQAKEYNALSIRFDIVLDKLSKYEDTGLEPEEIKGLGKWIDELRKELREYKDLEEQGRLHISPVADGTDIFVPYTDWFDDENVKEVIKDTYVHGYTEFENGEMNNGLFLTLEEAEKALEAANERN